MNTSQVAIVLKESEENINFLVNSMHVWLAQTDENNKIINSLSVTSLPKELTLSTFEVTGISTIEEQCIIGIELVEMHHSSTFDGTVWLEIQVHGCELTEKLEREFLECENTKITKQNYGFKVNRPNEK